jgi:Kef-type K+ transport system membrane component KefB
MPEEVSFSGLAIVAAIAFSAPLLLGLAPRLRVPAVIFEIGAGVAIGPGGLGWVEPDLPIRIGAILGLTFLLLLAGLELDVEHLRGPLLKSSLVGLAASAAVALGAAGLLWATGIVDAPFLIAIVLISTSLGLVVPVLKDAGEITSRFGQLTIAGSSIADIAAVVLLSLFFSEESRDVGAQAILLGGFLLLLAVGGAAIAEVGRWSRLSAVLLKLQDSTAEIRVRGAVLLMLATVILAERFGLEVILGAFLGGAILKLVDRRAMETHPYFHTKLEAIGYGFLIPIFFVSSGLSLDARGLVADPADLVLVPIFLIAMLAARGLPALLYTRIIGRQQAVAAGLLQATSLPFIVVATQIGLDLGMVTSSVATAFVAAGLLSVLVFPASAATLLKGDGESNRVSQPDSGAREGVMR